VTDRTTIAFRVVPLLLLAGTSLMATIVVLGNVTDPGSNLKFIERIFSMDTTYQSPRLMWRAVRSKSLHRLAMVFIVVCETAVAATGWIGVAHLAANLHSPADQWYSAKFWAIVALGLATFVWFFLFEVIGNEWFASWQSSDWKATNETARINLITFAALILLHLAN
jgi:predicted small integral membrane protein